MARELKRRRSSVGELISGFTPRISVGALVSSADAVCANDNVERLSVDCKHTWVALMGELPRDRDALLAAGLAFGIEYAAALAIAACGVE